MNTPDIDIIIRPQKGAWLFILFAVLLGASASKMVLMEINPIWWVPVLIFFVALMLLSLFATPFAISVRPSLRTIELRYRLGHFSKSYSFDELDSIWSYVRVTNETDPEVVLEVRLTTGKCIVLARASAAWDRFAEPIGFSGAREPENLTDLRRRISSATGMRDLGFCN